jgi:glycosyltransferase involved in cell wall biosynthesis
VPLSLIYTGYIGFYSDEMALVYFHRDVLPLIKERHPDVKLYIVGKSPSKRVQSMASDSVIVTGYVDSMEEYLRQSWVSISPMRVGAGLKNKVLEAFMYELPVVATSLANMGIGAVDRRDILIGDDPRSFANAVCELLEDPELRHEIGRNGRRYVEANFSDDVVRNGLHEIYARAESAWNARRTGPSVP